MTTFFDKVFHRQVASTQLGEAREQVRRNAQALNQIEQNKNEQLEKLQALQRQAEALANRNKTQVKRKVKVRPEKRYYKVNKGVQGAGEQVKDAAEHIVQKNKEPVQEALKGAGEQVKNSDAMKTVLKTAKRNKALAIFTGMVAAISGTILLISEKSKELKILKRANTYNYYQDRFTRTRRTHFNY